MNMKFLVAEIDRLFLHDDVATAFDLYCLRVRVEDQCMKIDMATRCFIEEQTQATPDRVAEFMQGLTAICEEKFQMPVEICYHWRREYYYGARCDALDKD